jgi:hypothetical protein
VQAGLENYYQALLHFANHKSIMVASFAIPVWCTLLSHAEAVKTPALQAGDVTRALS